MDRFPPSTEYITRSECDAELTAQLAAFAVVNANVVLHLVDADFAFTPGMVAGDLSEASYTGYVAKSVAWSTWTVKQNEPGGPRRVESTTLVTFSGPAGGAGPTIYGYYLTEAGGATRLFRVVHFNTPFVLTDDTTVLNIINTLTQPAGQLSI